MTIFLKRLFLLLLELTGSNERNGKTSYCRLCWDVTIEWSKFTICVSMAEAKNEPFCTDPRGYEIVCLKGKVCECRRYLLPAATPF